MAARKTQSPDLAKRLSASDADGRGADAIPRARRIATTRDKGDRHSNRRDTPTASPILLPLVRLLARQAARESLIQSTSPASVAAANAGDRSQE